MARLIRACSAVMLLLIGLCAWAAEPYTIVAHGLQFLEGVILVDNVVYFVDYASSDVLRLQGDRVVQVWHQDGCGPTGLAQVEQGLMVACYDANTFVTVSLSGAVRETLTHDSKGNPFHVPNDLALDHGGGVYFTASGSGTTPGQVYYRHGSGDVISVATGLDNANGLVVSVDGKSLLVGESATDIIWQYPIGSDGRLGTRTRYIDLRALLHDTEHPHPGPDGVRIDRHGNLFVALYNGGGIVIFDPSGALLERITLPRSHHTNLALTSDEKSIYATAVDDVPAGGYQADLLLVPNPIARSR